MQTSSVLSSWLQNAAALISVVLLCDCSRDPTSDSDSTITLRAIALSKSRISNACYSLVARNSLGVLWEQPHLCSNAFGGDGSIAYVGFCDAAHADTTIHLDLQSVEVDGHILLPDEYVNPCPVGNDSCEISVECKQNSDVSATFPITIPIHAATGSVDALVDIDTISCSAKLDCVDALLPNNDGIAEKSAVLALSCETNECAESYLYMNDVVVECDGQPPIVVSPIGPQGDSGPLPGTAISRAARYYGHDESGRVQFFSLAFGLSLPEAKNCRLTATSTTSTQPFVPTGGGYTTPASSIYPYINWNVQLTDADGNLVCSEHPLDGLAPADGVATMFTEIASSGKNFHYELSKSNGDAELCTCECCGLPGARLKYSAKLGTLPEAQGFLFFDERGNPPPTISGGALHALCTAGIQYWQIPDPRPSETSATLEARLKIHSSNYIPNIGTGTREGYYFVFVMPNGDNYTFGLADEGFNINSVLTPNQALTSYPIAGDFHTYRVEVRDGSAALFIDGAEVAAGIRPMKGLVGGTSSFGGVAERSRSDTELQWLCYGD